MAEEKFEYYDTGDGAQTDIWQDVWDAQTFTPSTTHEITKVVLLLWRLGDCHTVTVSIKAVDGSGHPTGADLCVGTTDGDTLPTSAPYEWRTITFGTNPQLNSGTKYAIVVRALTANEWEALQWRLDTTGSYAGGNMERSTDGGSSWSTLANYDFMFEEWGNEVVALTHSYGQVIG